MMFEFIFFGGLFTWLTVMGVLKHQRKMAELQVRSGYQVGTNNSSQELLELTRQIAELRDTTTRYDMSFDSALQRLESRVGNLENKSAQSTTPVDQAYARRAE